MRHEAFVAAFASGDADEDHGRRCHLVQLDDRRHFCALGDVDRGRQAGHQRDLEAPNFPVVVAIHTEDNGRLLDRIHAGPAWNVWVLPRRRLAVLLKELNVDDVGHELEVRRGRRMRRLLLVRLPPDDLAVAILCEPVLFAVPLWHVHGERDGHAHISNCFLIVMRPIELARRDPRGLFKQTARATGSAPWQTTANSARPSSTRGAYLARYIK